VGGVCCFGAKKDLELGGESGNEKQQNENRLHQETGGGTGYRDKKLPKKTSLWGGCESLWCRQLNKSTWPQGGSRKKGKRKKKKTT